MPRAIFESACHRHAIRTDYFQATMGTCKIFFSVTASYRILPVPTASYRILPIEGPFAARRAANERLTSGKRVENSMEGGANGQILG